MKEALGELNGTIIVVIAVGLLTAFFFTVLWPNIKENFLHQADCANAVCDVGIISKSDRMVECHDPKDASMKNIFKCPYRG